jgi:CheY-like chemotaxis protein/HEAT repeat protein
MVDIDAQDLLDEIKFDIKEKDLIKGGLVLASLGHVDRKTQKQALLEVSRADDDFAIPLLASVISQNPEVTQSFPFIKETLFSKVMASSQVLLDLLSNKQTLPERTLLMEMAGEIRLQKAAPVLLEILAGEQDPRAIEVSITALGMIGDPSAADPVSEYLYAGSREVIVAAVRTLGQLATPAAIDHLAKRIGGDSELDTMILDVFAKAGVPEAVEKLNAALASSDAHIRTAGKKKLRAVGSTAVRVLIRNLSGKNQHLMIHSLNVLGDIGEAAAIPSVRKLLQNHPEDPNVRFAAYEALGKFPLDKGAFALAAGLEDPDGMVRSAAARAVDYNFNAALAAGLMNMIQAGGKESLEIVQTIIDAKCGNIFSGLWEEDSFRESAREYLIRKAHPDIRAFFEGILAVTGCGQLVDEEEATAEPAAQEKAKVFAVDDSKMVLNIYRSVLHNLGYEPHLFEFPAGALEQIQKQKPDVVLTDLNMPDITGIDLTKGVRKLYSKEQLPIIMVTTQDETNDNDAALSAGVNAILQKPFTEEQIGAILAEFVRP